MCKIVEVLGIPPGSLLEKATRTDKFFERGPGGTWTLKRLRDAKKVLIPVVAMSCFTIQPYRL